MSQPSSTRPMPHGLSDGPVPRPGKAVAAAVLAFVQAAATALTTALVWLTITGGQVIVNGDKDLIGAWEDGFGISVGLVQTVGLVLVVWGGVLVLVGRSRVPLVLGCLLEFVGSVIWIVWMTDLPEASLEVFEGSLGIGIAVAIAFSIMPMLSLVFAMNGRVTEFLTSRRR